MSKLISSIVNIGEEVTVDPIMAPATDLLASLVDASAYIGEVFSIGYSEALVQVHDYHRRHVGGVPALSFLLATRIQPDVKFDPKEEDSSVILLRKHFEFVWRTHSVSQVKLERHGITKM